MHTTHKKRIIILPLLAMLLAAAGVSFAVFTYQANKKGVISTVAKDVYFASNYLNLCENDTAAANALVPENYDGQTLIFKQDEQISSISFDFTVQNFVVAGTHNTNSITYELLFVLQGTAEGEDLSGYTIIRNGMTIASFEDTLFQTTVPYTLMGGYDRIDTFRVVMPVSALDHVQLLVVARPDTASLRYTNNKMLARNFSPCTSANVKQFAVTHDFSDAAISGKMPYDFDAFNYEISVNTGRGTITLQWDPTKVEIDPFFRGPDGNGELSRSPGSSADDTITFNMDAGSELVQFYRAEEKDSNQPWQQNWTNMEEVISVSGTQIVDGTTP